MSKVLMLMFLWLAACAASAEPTENVGGTEEPLYANSEFQNLYTCVALNSVPEGATPLTFWATAGDTNNAAGLAIGYWMVQQYRTVQPNQAVCAGGDHSPIDWDRDQYDPPVEHLGGLPSFPVPDYADDEWFCCYENGLYPVRYHWVRVVGISNSSGPLSPEFIYMHWHLNQFGTMFCNDYEYGFDFKCDKIKDGSGDCPHQKGGLLP